MSESNPCDSGPTPELKEILQRLHEHTSGTLDIDPLNLSDFVMIVTDNLGEASAVKVWENLGTVLEQLNTILNKDPDAMKNWRDLTYSGPLVYDMNIMIVDLLTSVVERRCTLEEASKFIQLAWRISKAWVAILGTDCESVIEYIDLEEFARGIEPLEDEEPSQD